jgi:hypothetical protein
LFICLFDDFYNELIDPIVNCDIVRKIASNIDFKNFIDLENKKLSYKNSNSVNYSQLIRLLNYLYVCLKNKDHKIDEIYNEYIFKIAKNSDIYALSMFIVNILKITSDDIHKITLEKTKLLEEDAKSNTINGPTELSEKLQEIIDSIP